MELFERYKANEKAKKDDLLEEKMFEEVQRVEEKTREG